MNVVFEHADGKLYEVDTTPEGTAFAEVYELRPRKASGVIANFLSEYTGQEQYTYTRAYLDDDELANLVLELGHKFSRSRGWRNLHNWAHFQRREK